MTMPEGASGGEIESVKERAISAFNNILFDAASMGRLTLGRASAQRLLEDTEGRFNLMPEVIDLLSQNITLLPKGIPLIPAIRTIEDFTLGDRAYVRWQNRSSSIVEGQFFDASRYSSDRVGVKIGDVRSFVIPGYIGLLNGYEHDYLYDRQARDRRKGFDYMSPIGVNLAITRLMTIAEIGDFSSKNTYLFMTRVARLEDSKVVRGLI
jgi:hypothetical protein